MRRLSSGEHIDLLRRSSSALAEERGLDRGTTPTPAGQREALDEDSVAPSALRLSSLEAAGSGSHRGPLGLRAHARDDLRQRVEERVDLRNRSPFARRDPEHRATLLR